MKRSAMFALIAGAVVCHAVEPPAWRQVGALQLRQLAVPPDFEIKLGSTAIRLETTTLHEVITLAAIGRVDHSGDAGGSRYWVCYAFRQGSAQYTLWLVSSPFGGTERAILDVLVAPSSAETSDCPAIPERLTPISFAGGISIGSTAGAAISGFGPSGPQGGGWHGYRYSVTIPGVCGGGGDAQQGGSIAARVEGGRVVALAAGRATGC